jgi:hypothetical protein
MAKEKEEAPQIRYEQIKQLYILVESGEATEEQRETLRELAEEVISDNTDLENIFNDDADRDGNTSDEDSSSKEEKAKEGKASESSSSIISSSSSSLSGSTSSSSSSALPEKIITLASIREVYKKFQAKGGEDGDSDDEELRGLEEEYFKYLDILRRQLNDRESEKNKIEKILEEFYQDCASNDIAKTDFWDIIYQTHNEDLIILSLLNLAARKVKEDFLEVIKIPARSYIEIYFKAFLKIQNEGKFNQITLNESIKNQQDKLLSVMDQVVKALSISIDSQEDENSDDEADTSFSQDYSESQSSSTSSSVSSLSESTISEVTISSVMPEIAAMPDTGGFSELAGDSAEAGEHLAG